jgi:hypothetical protein
MDGWLGRVKECAPGRELPSRNAGMTENLSTINMEWNILGSGNKWAEGGKK